MAKELRGKFKEPLWVRPTCQDKSDPLSLGRKARKDFKREARAEDRAVDVASIDMLDEAFELGDPPIRQND